MRTAGQLPDIWACLVRAEEKSQEAKAVHLVICQQRKNSGATQQEHPSKVCTV